LELLEYGDAGKQDMELNCCSSQAAASPLIPFASEISGDYSNVIGLRACGVSNIDSSSKSCLFEKPSFNASSSQEKTSQSLAENDAQTNKRCDNISPLLKRITSLSSSSYVALSLSLSLSLPDNVSLSSFLPN
jgi:hypothetical protein